MSLWILWGGALYPGERTRRLEHGTWGGLDAGDFTDGRRLAVTGPIEIELVADDKGTAVMPPLFTVPALVVHRDVAEVLREAGVDNIDFYPAVLFDGTRAYDEYLLCNVIGLVDAVDKRRSKTRMVLDEKKTGGLGLFRLKQRPSLVVIDERVRMRLAARAFPYLHIVRPEDFA